MFNKSLTQTTIPIILWDLHDKNREEFEREVKAYLSLRYPLYQLDSYDREKKQVFMR